VLGPHRVASLPVGSKVMKIVAGIAETHITNTARKKIKETSSLSLRVISCGLRLYWLSQAFS
jgi:hypothetical protein